MTMMVLLYGGRSHGRLLNLPACATHYVDRGERFIRTSNTLAIPIFSLGGRHVDLRLVRVHGRGRNVTVEVDPLDQAPGGQPASA